MVRPHRDFEKTILHELKWRVFCEHTNDPKHISCYTRELASNLHMSARDIGKTLSNLVEDGILEHGRTPEGRDYFLFKDPKQIRPMQIIKSYQQKIKQIYEIAKKSAEKVRKQPAYYNVEMKPIEDWRRIKITKKPFRDEKGRTHIFPTRVRTTKRTAKIHKVGFKKLEEFCDYLNQMITYGDSISNAVLIGTIPNNKENNKAILEMKMWTFKKCGELCRYATQNLNYLEKTIVDDKIGFEMPMLYHMKQIEKASKLKLNS